MSESKSSNSQDLNDMFREIYKLFTFFAFFIFLSSTFISTSYGLAIRPSCSSTEIIQGPSGPESWCGQCTYTPPNCTGESLGKGYAKIFHFQSGRYTYSHDQCESACYTLPAEGNETGSCSNVAVRSTRSTPNSEGGTDDGLFGAVYEDSRDVLFNLTVEHPNTDFVISGIDNDPSKTSLIPYRILTSDANGKLQFTQQASIFKTTGNHSLIFRRVDSNAGDQYCVINYSSQATTVPLYDDALDPATAFDTCNLDIQKNPNDSITVIGINVPFKLMGWLPYQPTYRLRLIGSSNNNIDLTSGGQAFDIKAPSSGLLGSFTVTSTTKFEKNTNYTIALTYDHVTKVAAPEITTCQNTFSLDSEGEIDQTEDGEAVLNPELADICTSLPLDQVNRCQACVLGADVGDTKAPYPGSTGAYTAFGCMPADLPSFLKDYLFTIGLGFAGGIAFLLMLWGGFTILISQGDSHKIQLGREIIVSAGVGLLFIIFAIVILQIIGKDILDLPGFGGE